MLEQASRICEHHRVMVGGEPTGARSVRIETGQYLPMSTAFIKLAEDAAGYRGGLLGKQMSINLATLKSYVKEARAKFATGMLDPDNETDWNTYLKTMEDMGLSTLIKNTQSAVDREAAKSQQ